MKTAVEWLEERLKHLVEKEYFHHAKKMEKEQIVDAVDTTIEKMNVLDNFRTLKNGEQYYNETFKQQEQ